MGRPTERSGWRRWWAAAVVLGCMVAAGCGTETGILLEVTRDDGVPAEIDKLSIYVGESLGGDHPESYFDGDPDEELSVGGRDLKEDPYLLMVRPDEHPDRWYMAVAIAYRDDQVVGVGTLDRPVTFKEGAVTKWPVVLSGAAGGFDVTDTGCVRLVDDSGETVTIGSDDDRDCDGYQKGEDCDDRDPHVHPGKSEQCGNAVDDDCDGTTDENVDDDQDGVFTCDGDCDDNNPAVNPGAKEICDGIDNNCNGSCDEGLDVDGDTFTTCASRPSDASTCSLDPSFIDCDDGDELSYPGAAEICDGKDNDCNEMCDDDAALDPDNDRYTDCGSVVGICGTNVAFEDCEPNDGGIHPAAAELCDGKDNNCDGAFLTFRPCFTELNGEMCSRGTQTCNETDDGSPVTIGTCQAALDAAEGREVCEAYRACEESDPVEPYLCVADDPATVDCVMHFKASTLAQCPRNIAVVADKTGDTCTWSIMGGAAQGDYVVSLQSGSNAANQGVAIQACDPVLIATFAGTPPSGPTLVTLVGVEDGVAREVWIRLSSEPSDACAGLESGLACEPFF